MLGMGAKCVKANNSLRGASALAGQAGGGSADTHFPVTQVGLFEASTGPKEQKT